MEVYGIRGAGQELVQPEGVRSSADAAVALADGVAGPGRLVRVHVVFVLPTGALVATYQPHVEGILGAALSVAMLLPDNEYYSNTVRQSPSQKQDTET